MLSPVVRLALSILIVLVSACERADVPTDARPAALQPAAFWVWHRSSPLTAEEHSSLQTAGTRELFWQVVETGWTNGRWESVRISPPLPPVAEVRIIPVFRIKPDPAFLDQADAVPAFARVVHLWSDGNLPEEIQLDFDCPDRVLGRYSDFLRSLAKALPETRISITALASWPHNPHFGKLANSVHRMAPMFYDLHPDRPENVVEGTLRPIADRGDIGLIRLWQKCPVPWLAGLPNFERVSMFRPDGTLAGHLRGWSHDALFFNPHLQPQPSGNGVTRFQVTRDTTVSGNPITAGSIVCHRGPEKDSLTALAEAAMKYGATGMLYFTLPGPGIQATHPAPHFTGDATALPVLSVLSDGRLQLTNTGTDGIPPRPCDPNDPTSPGWRVTIESSTTGAFRSASTGDFPKVSSTGDVPPEMSMRLHLHFSKLPPGQSLTSGPLVNSPGELVWSLEPHVSRRPVVFR